MWLCMPTTKAPRAVRRMWNSNLIHLLMHDFIHTSARQWTGRGGMEAPHYPQRSKPGGVSQEEQASWVRVGHLSLLQSPLPSLRCLVSPHLILTSVICISSPLLSIASLPSFAGRHGRNGTSRASDLPIGFLPRPQALRRPRDSAQP